MTAVTLVRVQRTRDRVWRVEHHHDGRVDLRLHGALVLQRRTLAEVHRRLRDEGIDPEELVED